MNERGVVIEHDGATVLVSFNLGHSCFGCDAQGSCSARDRSVRARVPDGLSIAQGDYVEVSVPAGTRWSALLWLLVVPLGLFALGYSLVAVFAHTASEGPAALAGLGGFALGLGIAVLATRAGRMAKMPMVCSRIYDIPADELPVSCRQGNEDTSGRSVTP
ncbi:MAG TPA: SoxR reducing system RseC family protein [Spirochaetales bacterium]|nr:SoxR reducing system RseC family protein [Spirochaetales bacterium]